MTPTLNRDVDLLRYGVGDRSGPLSRLLAERALRPVFQPIVSLSDGRIHAHEALIRGPRGMPLHTPDALLAAARNEGLLQDLEVACVAFALDRWRQVGNGGRLFINVSAEALVKCFHDRSAHQIASFIRGIGLDPGAIVFEITEHERVGDVPLLVDVATTVHAAGMAFALDDFGDGRYHGLGTGHQLVRDVTESRIEAARHANPLTFLPGNIPISEHIERLLASGTEFAAVYGDLKDFKPFNDYYGYWQGDTVIKLLANTLQACADPQRDFVGHVGGDDFVVLFQSGDWPRRCAQAIADFNAAVVRQYDDAAQRAGGITNEDRHGVQRHFGFTTLYMGAIRMHAGDGGTAASVATAAAKAKQIAKVRGVGLVINDDRS